jgi:hypothetical protein
MPVGKQHGSDVDEFARRALDRELAAVNNRPHFIDHNTATVDR